MLVKGDAALRRAKSTDRQSRFFLIFGPDLGLNAQIGDDLIAGRGLAPATIRRLYESDLANPDVLRNALRQSSLFDEITAIRIKLSSESLSAYLVKTLGQAPQGGPLVLIETEELPKKSKLRGWFETSDQHLALQTFAQSPAQLADWAVEHLAAAGKTADVGLIAGWIGDHHLDRSLLAQELDKIIAFVGAEDRIDKSALDAIASGSGEVGVDDIVDGLFRGDLVGLSASLQQALDSGANAITILKATEWRLNRLYLATLATRDGGGVEVLRPPAFGAERETLRALARRPPALAAGLLDLIRQADIAIKSNASLGPILCERALMEAALRLRESPT